MAEITELRAFEILDSRGRPTVLCGTRLASGAQGWASVPSGASTGRHEAWELRDGDPARYQGLGCRQAVHHIKGEIQNSLRGLDLASQRTLDDHLIALDGTETKSRLGANALLAVSVSFAKASTVERDLELYAYFGSLMSAAEPLNPTLPLPTINLFSGGRHAGGQVSIQDVLIVPLPEGTFPDQMAMMSAIYASAVEYVNRRYGMRNLTADEGGLAPAFRSSSEMLEAAMTCARAAGLEPGRDFRLAVDVAASHFHFPDGYRLDGTQVDTEELIDIYAGWCDSYPIYSLEDGLDEEDWAGWERLTARLGSRTLVLGDDLLCTNTHRIRQAQARRAANALLLKVNQIGTLSEALDALDLARREDWHIVISARSGETEDTWLADLAVGWRADNIKVGSITQSERLAKYNRLLVLADRFHPSP